MSSANSVPETTGLTGHRALATIKQANVGLLLRDSITRLRVADGLSHSRALAFQLVLALIPGTIVLVAVASLFHWESLSNAIITSVESLAPGPSADVFRDAFSQGSGRGSSHSSRSALIVGLPTLFTAGTTAFGQIERAANRLYGVEADRPTKGKYGVAVALLFTAGTLSLLYFLVVGLGAAWTSDGSSFATLWAIARWPIGLLLLAGAFAIVFKVSPRRRQPQMAWLAVGGLIGVVGCLLVSVGLALYLTASKSFGEEYGPLAGFMGVMLWAYGNSTALLFGLSFAAQLEAFRAGVPKPRDDDKVRDSEPDSITIPYGAAAMRHGP
jgi:YihY family inner membrane protein